MDLTKATTNLEALAETLNTIVPIIAIIALIVCGILFMVSTRRSSDDAKDWAKRILVGVIIAFAAQSIVNFAQTIASGF